MTTEAGRRLRDWFMQEWRAPWLLPHIDGHIAAIEAEAAAAERERMADWLASELDYPLGFAEPPPVSLDDMAAAWHRLDPSLSLAEWRDAIEADWPVVEVWPR